MKDLINEPLSNWEKINIAIDNHLQELKNNSSKCDILANVKRVAASSERNQYSSMLDRTRLYRFKIKFEYSEIDFDEEDVNNLITNLKTQIDLVDNHVFNVEYSIDAKNQIITIYTKCLYKILDQAKYSDDYKTLNKFRSNFVIVEKNIQPWVVLDSIDKDLFYQYVFNLIDLILESVNRTAGITYAYQIAVSKSIEKDDLMNNVEKAIRDKDYETFKQIFSIFTSSKLIDFPNRISVYKNGKEINEINVLDKDNFIKINNIRKITK